jgi:hypothetical protein
MTTTHAPLEEPDLRAEAVKNQACERLRDFLITCGDARGDGLWLEECDLETEEGAQVFAERFRRLFCGCAGAKWVGVRQHGNQVRVWIIARCQGRHPDSIEPDWPDIPE